AHGVAVVTLGLGGLVVGLRFGDLLLGLFDERLGVGIHLAALRLLDEVLRLLDDDGTVEGQGGGRDREDEREGEDDPFHGRKSSTPPRGHGLRARTSRNTGRRRSSWDCGCAASHRASGTGSSTRSTI